MKDKLAEYADLADDCASDASCDRSAHEVGSGGVRGQHRQLDFWHQSAAMSFRKTKSPDPWTKSCVGRRLQSSSGERGGRGGAKSARGPLRTRLAFALAGECARSEALSVACQGRVSDDD